jgi:hypothetical protein
MGPEFMEDPRFTAARLAVGSIYAQKKYLMSKTL